MKILFKDNQSLMEYLNKIPEEEKGNYDFHITSKVYFELEIKKGAI